MGFFTLVLLAIGLSMDCLAVSATCAMMQEKVVLKKIALMAGLFGFFQMAMPLISWLLGSNFAQQIQSYDHWLAFAILAFIGGKMIYESFEKKTENKQYQSLTLKTMLLLALATSIDALATGLIFIGQNDVILKALIIIGITSFLFSIIGFWIGQKFKQNLKIRFDLIGGIILVGIGVKILIEHLFFS
ncbi:MAG: manganese efflux pump MntP family protein [Bacteroidales bacterium]|jgi:putative Mn2+ efflux pump MntP|nr:manganese efflux pump MntP family protein [Bacteroidales bacterium]